MKLRLRENSIRLRLLQCEVEQLRIDGIVSEKIRFGEFQILTYTLKSSNHAAKISACLANDEITIEIPSVAARNWAETNLVGLANDQAIGDDSTLKITIEKDFVCLDRPFDTDNADAFPHPKMNCD